MAERRAMIYSLLLIGLVAQCTAAPSDDPCDIHALDNCAADLFVFATRNTVPRKRKLIWKLSASPRSKRRSAAAITSRGARAAWPRAWATSFWTTSRRRSRNAATRRLNTIRSTSSTLHASTKVGSKFNTCIKNTIADLDVASRLEPRQRIAGACCQYSKLEDCVSSAVGSTCPPGGARLRQERPEALRRRAAGHRVRGIPEQGEVQCDQVRRQTGRRQPALCDHAAHQSGSRSTGLTTARCAY
ncbi:hypothetical protein MTO96_007542 [Rhipicephalus appendiculatus]